MQKRLITYSLTYLLLSICSCLQLQAQEKFNNVWTFGRRAGVDFNSGMPVSFVSAIDQWEGCASVCNETGALQFYTDGSNFWNRNHALMPNGNRLLPDNIYSDVTYSTAQATTIVQMPDSADKYIVFSLSNEQSNRPGRLYYTVVDMTMEGGLGNVVASRSVLLMDTLLDERMTVVKSDCSAWLIVHARSSLAYKAYEITNAGINFTPIISYGVISGLGSTFQAGITKVSPDKMILASTWVESGVELCSFDIATGMVTNAVQLDAEGYYGACFSPNTTKLYLTGLSDTVIQFDLSLGSPAAIIASKIVVGSIESGGLGDMKIGPDSNIYIAYGGNTAPTSTGNHLAAINMPENAGVSCQFIPAAVKLQSSTYAMGGLPNDAVVFPRDTIFTTRFLSLTSQSANIPLRARPGFYNYEWDNASTDSVRTVTTCGKYWCVYKETPCKVFIDSFNVNYQWQIEVSKIDSSCNNNRFVINSSDTMPYNYTWRSVDGDIIKKSTNKTNGDSLLNPATGSYDVVIESINGCDTTIPFHMMQLPSVLLNGVTPDTIIAYGDSIRLQAAGAIDYLWSPTQWLNDPLVADPIASPKEPVVYMVVGSNTEGCTDTAYVNINIDYTMYEFIPSAFSPNGDGRNERFKVINLRYQELQDMKIFNRWGKLIFQVSGNNPGWDGTYNGKLQDVGNYFYVITISLPDGKVKTYKGEVTLIK